MCAICTCINKGAAGDQRAGGGGFGCLAFPSISNIDNTTSNIDNTTSNNSKEQHN